MLDLNCDLVMSDFTNLCNAFSVEWFLVLMNPLVDTSKQFTLHFSSEMSAAKWEYFCFFQVPGLDVSLWWACELKQMDGLFVIVNDHNVRLQWSYTDFRGDRASARGSVPRQVTIHSELFINWVILELHCKAEIDSHCFDSLLDSQLILFFVPFDAFLFPLLAPQVLL